MPLLALGGIEAVLGLYQYAAGADVTGRNDNRDHLAGFLEMTLPFVLMYGLVSFPATDRQRSLAVVGILKGVLFLALAAALCAAITFTGSKAGMISMLGSLLVMGAIATSMKLAGPTLWAAVVGLAGLLLTLFVVLPPDAVVDAFGSAAFDPTGEGRFPIWKDTLHMIAAYPLFGSGLGTYFPAFMRYQTSGVELAWISAHNDYLEFFSELGLAGFLPLAGFVCASLVCAVGAATRGLHRETRLLGLACTGAMAAILIHSAADFNMHVPSNALILMWITGIAVALPDVSNERLSWTHAGSGLVRGFLLVGGCSATVYGGGWLLYLHHFAGDLSAERLFCRFGICESYQAANTLKQQYGGAKMVPPDKLLVYLQRDPAGPYRWEDLGVSLQRAGRIDEARYCFERAFVLSPQIPMMLLPIARFFFGQGEKARGFELTRRILERSPDWLSLNEFGPEVTLEEILREGLGKNPRAWAAALRWRIRQDDLAGAITIWNALLAHGYAADPTAIEMVRFLLRHKHLAEAARAWAEYRGPPGGEYLKSNYIFNGDFETAPVGPLDWRLESGGPGFKVAIDPETAHSGRRSARVTFDGTENVDNISVAESAFVPPGRYRFHAYVKLDEVTTDRGVSFEILGKGWKAETDDMIGTQDWRLVETEFQVPAGEGLVEVRLFRRKSLKFDSLIHGTVWIDQVSIKPEITSHPR